MANTSGKKIAAMLKKRNISQLSIIKILKDLDIMDLSEDTLSRKLSGAATISADELAIWAKVLQCNISELVDEPISSSIDNAINVINIANEIKTLQPIPLWHPIKPTMTNNYYRWTDESRHQLLIFYNEYDIDTCINEYQISKSILVNQLSRARKKYPALVSNRMPKNKATQFINFYNNNGIIATMKAYMISENKLKLYISYIEAGYVK